MRKEVPALEGNVHVSSIKLDRAKTIITVEGTWSNKSPYRVRVDVNLSQIRIYVLSDKQPNGHIDPLFLEKPIYTTQLFRNYSYYEFDPNVAWKIQEHYVLETGKIYMINWYLVREKTKNKNFEEPIVWESSLICDCRHLKATN